MKLILIHASITNCGFDSFGRGDPTESSWINHGLCSISAYIKDKGVSVALIDLRRLQDWEDFRNKIMIQQPDVVGLSMMSVDYNPVIKCVKIIKAINNKIITVVGGAHPSIQTEELVGNADIDYIIKGEGEISFYNLLMDISKGEQVERIMQGIVPDLDSLPFVDRQLYQGNEMPIVDLFEQPFVTIIAGRGCIYNCSFCQPAERLIFGSKVRRRSVENVIKELETLRKEYNFKSLMIHDDCLTEDETWIYKFCQAYKKNKFSQEFICQSRADIICKKEEMIRLMSEAGLKMFIIGFESGNQRILNFLRKGTTVEQNYKAAQICRKYGIKIFANYMLGIPTETKKEVMDTVKMIREIKPDHCSAAFFTPHPGSDLYNYCMKNNLSLIKNHDDYRRNPKNAKIRGINYVFLSQAATLSMGRFAHKTFLDIVIASSIGKSIRSLMKKNTLGKKAITFMKELLKYGRKE